MFWALAKRLAYVAGLLALSYSVFFSLAWESLPLAALAAGAMLLGGRRLRETPKGNELLGSRVASAIPGERRDLSRTPGTGCAASSTPTHADAATSRTSSLTTMGADASSGRTGASSRSTHPHRDSTP